MSAISTPVDASSSGATVRIRCAVLVALLSAAVPALADEEKTPSVPPAQAVPLGAYATDNPSCLEWTDGCTICAKPDSGEPHCSTPGIACQPAGIQCKKKSP
jgi:hypothetical protein